MAYPLNDTAMPFNNSDVPAGKVAAITSVIAYLKVNESAHMRYWPHNHLTFCNFYAYDFTYLMGSRINKYFIPIVWWNKGAIENLKNGIAQRTVYAKTVSDMSANGIYAWFKAFGASFGWHEQPNLDMVQDYVNNTGEIGIIIGQKLGGHGHITVVVPEQCAPSGSGLSAVRDGSSHIINPLQSQAGATNFQYGHSTIAGKPWFTTDGHVSSFYIFKRS